MNQMKALFVTGVIALVGCKQNPFPESGSLLHREPTKPTRMLPPLVLDIPSNVEVSEGQKVEIPVKASVPAPGQAIVSVQGLPEGAVFSADKGLITWTPGFDSANDTNDENVIVRMYPIEVMLSSSEDPVTIAQRSTVLVVRDVPRTLKWNMPADAQKLKEGTPFEQVIDVSSEDFPKGPFEIQIKNMPVGLVVSRDPLFPARFKLSYTPSYREVDVNQTASSFMPYVERPLDVTVFGPRGIHINSTLKWVIYDVRQNTIVLAPTTITQGTSVSFSVTAEDPNGETIPALSLYPKPLFGVAELRLESTNEGNAARGINPSAIATFRWTQIPPEKIGKTEFVNIRACVNRNCWSRDFCMDQKVGVTFEKEFHKPPVVDRVQYPLGIIKYMRQNDVAKVYLGVKDGEFSSTIPTVKITPDSLSDEVKWAWGQIEITAKRIGLKQFSLTATSVYGVSQVESFLLEVLPWSWNPVLIFGEGPSDNEMKETGKLFESAQMANPALQLDDPRLMVLRNSVYLTTGAFGEPTVTAQMEKLAATAGDIIVATPLLDKLQGSVKAELESADVIVGARLPDITGYSLEIDPGSGLTPPANPILLAGKLTRESSRPTPVNYKGWQKRCRTLLVLKKAGSDDVPVALACRRKLQGTIVIAGIELGDVQTSPADNRIVKKWLSGLVTVTQ